MTNTIKSITVSDLADTLGTDPRTTRKFLRSVTPVEDHPGKGSRWAIDGKAANIKALTKQFATFAEAMRAKGEVDAPEVDATDAE